jgi:hypothetical protein
VRWPSPIAPPAVGHALYVGMSNPPQVNKQLKLDVMHGNRHLYTIPMMDLFSSEEQLAGGRFEHFSRDQQEWKVSLRFDQGTGEAFRREFHERVEWIAEQACEDWSILCSPESVGKMAIEFSFRNVTTAVVFKLVWF